MKENSYLCRSASNFSVFTTCVTSCTVSLQHSGCLITNRLQNTYDFLVSSIYGKKGIELFSIFNNGTSLAKIRPDTNRTLLQHLFWYNIYLYFLPIVQICIHQHITETLITLPSRMQFYIHSLLTFLKKALQRQYTTIIHEMSG